MPGLAFQAVPVDPTHFRIGRSERSKASNWARFLHVSISTSLHRCAGARVSRPRSATSLVHVPWRTVPGLPKGREKVAREGRYPPSSARLGFTAQRHVLYTSLSEDPLLCNVPLRVMYDLSEESAPPSGLVL
eukprot:scaffold64_cov338-Pavlova_lutheri.AAC.79